MKNFLIYIVTTLGIMVIGLLTGMVLHLYVDFLKTLGNLGFIILIGSYIILVSVTAYLKRNKLF